MLPSAIAATVFKVYVSQEMAFETSQKYKEGKFIIEKARLMKVGYWYHYLELQSFWAATALLKSSQSQVSTRLHLYRRGTGSSTFISAVLDQ